MAPNLFIAAQTVCQPNKWFRKPSPPCQIKQTEEWSDPIPGRYRHTARGWYLIATRDTATGECTELERSDWQRVVYWHLRHRYELQRVVMSRSKEGSIEGRDPAKKRLFYNLPDGVGVSWVQCWDRDGEESVPGPYPRYLLNINGEFSLMSKAEARELYPARPAHSRNHSVASMATISDDGDSLASSVHPSAINTPSGSRRPSLEQRRPSYPRNNPSKRDSLAVPSSRPRSRDLSSRGTTPSPATTPAMELNLKELEAKIGNVERERRV